MPMLHVLFEESDWIIYFLSIGRDIIQDRLGSIQYFWLVMMIYLFLVGTTITAGENNYQLLADTGENSYESRFGKISSPHTWDLWI